MLSPFGSPDDVIFSRLRLFRRECRFFKSAVSIASMLRRYAPRFHRVRPKYRAIPTALMCAVAGSSKWANYAA